MHSLHKHNNSGSDKPKSRFHSERSKSREYQKVGSSHGERSGSNFNHTQRRNQVDIKLFAGQIPKIWDENQLKAFFERYGEILKVNIIRDKNNQHKGCGFIQFASILSANKAIKTLESVKLPGMQNPVILRWADNEPDRLGLHQDQDHILYVAQLPRNTSEREIRDVFEEFGRVREVDIPRDQQGLTRGFVFVKFENVEQSILAKQALNDKYPFQKQSKPLVVKYYEQNKKGSKEGEKEVSIRGHYDNKRDDNATSSERWGDNNRGTIHGRNLDNRDTWKQERDEGSERWNQHRGDNHFESRQDPRWNDNHGDRHGGRLEESRGSQPGNSQAQRERYEGSGNYYPSRAENQSTYPREEGREPNFNYQSSFRPSNGYPPADQKGYQRQDSRERERSKQSRFPEYPEREDPSSRLSGPDAYRRPSNFSSGQPPISRDYHPYRPNDSYNGVVKDQIQSGDFKQFAQNRNSNLGFSDDQQYRQQQQPPIKEISKDLEFNRAPIIPYYSKESSQIQHPEKQSQSNGHFSQNPNQQQPYPAQPYYPGEQQQTQQVLPYGGSQGYQNNVQRGYYGQNMTQAQPVISSLPPQLTPTPTERIFYKYFTADKVPYYYDTATQQTQYEMPPLGSQIFNPDGTQEHVQPESLEQLQKFQQDIGGEDLKELDILSQKASGPPGANLFIFHLPGDYRDSDLFRLFSKFGDLISAHVVNGPNGFSKGFGFVSYAHPDSAQKAIEAMNGILVGNKKLKVEIKKTQGEQTNYGQSHQPYQ